MAKRNSVSVLASTPIHGGEGIHGAFGSCLPGFLRIGIMGVMAVDEPVGRGETGVGPERLAAAVAELHRKD